ncbi:MAG TPA: AAA family ATPase [Candidatus Competibacteraceae bacterium]|jgi:predicted kinase|nr:AAA family ATPase [Candidatus Competibacteraceae bacterium]
MEAILFIGGQAAGKSTFYQQRFRDTHLRINLDMLRTRHREAILLEACLRMQQPFVVDNTNPTREDRRRYIPLAREAGFRVVGYYFALRLEVALARNAQREGRQCIPEHGVRATYRKLERPNQDEGFDALHYVQAVGGCRFIVEEWRDEL